MSRREARRAISALYGTGITGLISIPPKKPSMLYAIGLDCSGDPCRLRRRRGTVLAAIACSSAKTVARNLAE